MDFSATPANIEEDCLMYHFAEGKMRDTRCTSDVKTAALCEKAPLLEPQIPDPTVLDPTGNTDYFSFNAYCFIVLFNRMSDQQWL